MIGVYERRCDVSNPLLYREPDKYVSVGGSQTCHAHAPGRSLAWGLCDGVGRISRNSAKPDLLTSCSVSVSVVHGLTWDTRRYQFVFNYGFGKYSVPSLLQGKWP